MFFSIVQQADTFKCWYTLRYPMQELLCMTVVWTKHKKLSTLCLITWENCRVLSSGYSTFSYFEELKLGKRLSISKKCLPSLYTCNQREYSISECVLGTVSHVDFLSLWKLRGGTTTISIHCLWKFINSRREVSTKKFKFMGTARKKNLKADF